jgi:hypothetical protein
MAAMLVLTCDYTAKLRYSTKVLLFSISNSKFQYSEKDNETYLSLTLEAILKLTLTMVLGSAD